MIKCFFPAHSFSESAAFYYCNLSTATAASPNTVKTTPAIILSESLIPKHLNLIVYLILFFFLPQPKITAAAPMIHANAYTNDQLYYANHDHNRIL